jgi:hypothetical protein
LPTQVINTRYEIIETESHPEASPFIVSKARDVVAGRVVTLQVLPLDRASDRDAVRAAVSEAMRLEHPNITRVFEQGDVESTGELYVASEFLRGITLQERIRRVAPFSLTVATDIAVAVSEALEAAHRAGVIHGDLRPRDVLLSPEGQIKVGSFAYGAAALSNPRSKNAPTVAADVAAVGSLLYEMLTGSPPPRTTGPTPPSPRTQNNGVPPSLDGIVQKALYSDPAVRYHSAAALLIDLQAFREALQKGRSLSWSPLTDRRTPRPAAAETTIVTPRPVEVDAVAVGAATALAEPTSRRSRPSPSSPSPEEDTEDRYMPVERERSNPMGKILGFVFFLTVVGVAGLVWYISQFLAIPNDIQVPTLVGKTMDEARQMAAQQHFALVEGGSDYSTKWPENQIYKQDPEPGRTIKAKQQVSVFRSLGPRLLKVPRLVGETRARAMSDMQDIGLPEGTVTEEYSETIQKGVVLQQTPDADSMVARNTVINFIVSKGRQPPDPPADVSGDAPSFDTANVHWDAAPRAESYTVSRILNGDTTIVAKGLVDTHFTDRGLQPDTTYSYNIDAVNSAGPSGASEPAVITTQAKPIAIPVLPPSSQVKPAGTTPPPTPDSTAPNMGPDSTITPPPDDGPAPSAKMRQFTVAFRVPRHPRKARRVQFEVQDVTGTNLVYDETHQAGDEISAPVQGFGNKITIRIFIDGSLVKQQTM